MPWGPIQLKDGREIPSISFGTGRLGNGDGPITQIGQAISLGFSHIDTAQSYKNETEAGVAIRESGIDRKELFITTKYSGRDNLDIKTAFKNSLDKLGVSYVDLYLIHTPRVALPDIPTAWKELEDFHAQGLAKSIGVSNFEVDDLAILLASAKVKPVVNQILLHPYVYARQLPILEYTAKHDIVIEAYSPLRPITKHPGGPLDAPVGEIAEGLGVSNEQVLLAWAKAKGAVVVTTSTKKERLQGYLDAGNLALTDDDIAAIDAAGAKGAPL
ncbi:NADP-dependent oxidoreductase domain-containing protein [Mycena maculata]|uniref:NADP-dependent oxidoreductase domain-containing protein n=1 Tax=Mycena maculata TaxID=230809 RepID=A0AAD7NZL3_9AGAR|nr:NADP-dependent oxidoreductase domain-containing protein [Mycena maculata]